MTQPRSVGFHQPPGAHRHILQRGNDMASFGMKGRGPSQCQQGQVLLQQGSSRQQRTSLVTRWLSPVCRDRSTH